jgi:hypothetical protein
MVMLQARAQAELELRKRIGINGRRQAWSPLPGPQAAAYETGAFETLYGGAAGGGKSDLLLGLARYKHRRSLLFRRTFPDAERSLISRSLEFYGPRKYYNATNHVWSLNNHRVEIGHLEYDKDVYQYQGAQYDLIGFDELTQFNRFQYEYMISRARTTKKGQRVRIVATSNPGGEGNDWVMQRWAAWLDENHPNPADPGELRYYKRLPNGDEVETTSDDPDAVSRTFIPAKLSDNPYLGEEYRRTLNLLPEPLRSHLLNGDWQAGLEDDAYQVIPKSWIKAAQARWKPKPPGPLEQVGADISRGGDDKTVISKRHGYWFAPLIKHEGRTVPNGPAAAGLIVQALGRERPRINVDVIGYGSSCYDFLIDSGLQNVYGINFAERSEKKDKSGRLKMRNVRAAAYWGFREALDPVTGDDLALPPDSELLADLIAPKWRLSAQGIQIEEKEEIIKRLKRSPDCGDAVVLAYYGEGLAGWNDVEGLGTLEDIENPFA